MLPNRAKTKTGEMVYGYYFATAGSDHFGPSHYIVVEKVHDRKSLTFSVGGQGFSCYKVDPKTLAWNTGVEDSKGNIVWGCKEYEPGRMSDGGDKFKGNLSGTTYAVVYRDGEYILVYDSESPPVDNYKHCSLYHGIANLDLEIIACEGGE